MNFSTFSENKTVEFNMKKICSVILALSLMMSMIVSLTACTPEEVYYSPENLFVARFIGSPKINILPTKIYNFFFEPANLCNDDSLCVGIRPENIMLIHNNFDNCEKCGIITLIEMLGKEFSVHVQIGNHSLIVSIPAHMFNAKFQRGKKVKCVADEEKVSIFDMLSGKRIHKNSLHV